MFRSLFRLFRGNSVERTVPVSSFTGRISPETRDQVWVMYHGPNEYGQCYCCSALISRSNQTQRQARSWHCSHVVASVKDGPDTVENLRTCCQKCNLSMGNQNLYAYIRDKKLKGPGSSNVKAYFRKHKSQRFSRRTNNYGRK